MNDRILYIISLIVALVSIELLLSPSIVIAGETKDMQNGKLTIAEIQPGSRFHWPGGGSSGAGRWIVKEGKFDTPSAAYYSKDRGPAMFMGTLPDDFEETLQWSPNTSHILIGKNVLKGVTFDSDPNYPLTFRLFVVKGYIYVCGRGTVTTKNGKSYRLGFTDTVDMWLPLLHSDDKLLAEASAQALGYLAINPELKEKVIPDLVTAAKSQQFGVYWNACEALGRLGDARALPVLEELKLKKGYIGRLADESIKKIKGETH